MNDLGFSDPGQRLRWARDAVNLAWRIMDGVTLPDTPDSLPGEPTALVALTIEELSGVEIMIADAIDMWEAAVEPLRPHAAGDDGGGAR